MLLNSKPTAVNFALLILRVGVACFMLTHGWPKLAGFNEGLSTFPDPIGLGSEVSLTLVVFAEFFCSLLLALGLYTRLALVPLIINMIVVVFVVHGADAFGKKEHGLLFLVPYITLFLTGPGTYSFDAWFRKR